MRKLLPLVLLVSAASVAYAQEDYIELLRMDVKARKAEIITEAMQFTQEEAALFWPVFRNYEFELTAINDERLDLIKDYAERYETLTDNEAKDLVKRRLKLDEDRDKLRKRFFDEFGRVLPYKTVARFFQVETQLNLVLDLQIAWELPLIKHK
jgi:hypothetical protein